MEPITMPTPRPTTRENFLAEAVGARERKITYADGFRFGSGFALAFLLMVLVLGGLTWALIVLLNLH